MSELPLTTASPAHPSHPLTRHQLHAILSPAASIGPHERQRALVQASLLSRSPRSKPREAGGWVPG